VSTDLRKEIYEKDTAKEQKRGNNCIAEEFDVWWGCFIFPYK